MAGLAMPEYLEAYGFFLQLALILQYIVAQSVFRVERSTSYVKNYNSRTGS